ncbi:MAG: right-handed parallel beta-helix repeat-containing protein [Kiritimatiellae bacterium]|nr:right-handed parallel beta-helix repeat-containing protein [Kiritimatiellia bacterium]
MIANIAFFASVLTVSPGGLSPKAALETIRAAKAAGDVSAWTVTVRKGRYVLDETLVFTPADSGSPEAPVVWRGEDGAVISGGAPIAGWTDTGKGWWEAPIPKYADGTRVHFETFYANGRRAERARIPNEGYLTTETGVNSDVEKEGSSGKYYEETLHLYDDGAIAALAAMDAEDLANAQLLVRNKWAFSRRILRAVDAGAKTVTTVSVQPWAWWMQWDGESIFTFENVRAGFDAPGEWFYDAKGGVVCYRPLDGETLEGFEALAPTAGLSQLCAISGDPSAGVYVSDLRFENLVFEVSASTGGGRVPTESNMQQAAICCDGAWNVAGARRCVWDRCTIRRTGNYAMRFDNGVTHCEVLGTLMEDLGAGGVWMGADRGYVAEGETLSRRIVTTLAKESTAFNTISNCVIRHGGLFNPEGTGVALTHCSDTTVTRCDIYDMYYTGVSVGWTWGYAGSVAQRNTISFNRIHDLGKRVMSDMGGVYTLGTSFGTCVSNNVIWNVKAYRYGGWALYNDEGSEQVTMENNLCIDTFDAGYHQHYGVDNMIRNNIFALNERECSVKTERTPVDGMPSATHFVNNVVYTEAANLVYERTKNVGGVWARNLWYTSRGPGFVMRRDNGADDGSWDDFVATEREIGGVFADPLFVDVAARDFRLKPESPAFALGFKPFDPSLAGSDLLAECGE